MEFYFLFLRSAAMLLMSFLARADPGGIAYCTGEGTWPAEGEGTGGAAMVGGGKWGGTDVGGATVGSGSGFGNICFNRLFR